eukprot:82381-Chlamydomonas_euryale.AAC.11
MLRHAMTTCAPRAISPRAISFPENSTGSSGIGSSDGISSRCRLAQRCCEQAHPAVMATVDASKCITACQTRGRPNAWPVKQVVHQMHGLPNARSITRVACQKRGPPNAWPAKCVAH